MSKYQDFQSRQNNPHLKPWNSHFEDDRDEHGNLSRVASKRQTHGNTFFLIILIIILLIAIIAAIGFSIYYSNHANQALASETSISNNQAVIMKTSLSPTITKGWVYNVIRS